MLKTSKLESARLMSALWTRKYQMRCCPLLCKM